MFGTSTGPRTVAELVLALDLPGRDPVLHLLDQIGGPIWVKVGPVLFNRGGPDLVQELIGRGHTVFLDCKWHDIPSTVERAVESAGVLGVSMVTVHTLGGKAMLEAAKTGAEKSGTKVVGVTVLTSHTPEQFGAAVGHATPDLLPEVTRLTGVARDVGLDGVVCSPLEVSAVRNVLGSGFAIIVPGIRRAKDQQGDQHRLAEPGVVIEQGGTHLVVGRPIYNATSPPDAYRAFRKEIQ